MMYQLLSILNVIIMSPYRSFVQQVKILKEGADGFTKSKAVYQRLIEK